MFLVVPVSTQMENVILNLMKASFGDHLVDKIVACLDVYRDTSIQLKKPNSYNHFLREFKKSLVEQKAVWEQISVRNLGLIDADAVDASHVTQEEAAAFLGGPTPHESKAETSDQPDDNKDDLLDDL